MATANPRASCQAPLPLGSAMSVEALSDPLVIEQVEIQAKYQGYIDRQTEEVAKSLASEDACLPDDIDYSRIGGLSNEIQQKLVRHKPQTIGQASRIQGMTPAAISILLVYLKRGSAAPRPEGA